MSRRRKTKITLPHANLVDDRDMIVDSRGVGMGRGYSHEEALAANEQRKDLAVRELARAESAGDAAAALKAQAERDRANEAIVNIRMVSNRDRPRLRLDPMDRIADTLVRKTALFALRRAAEELITGRPIALANERLKDPEPDPTERKSLAERLEAMPPIKNPPKVPDPLDRWVKAPAAYAIDADGQTVAADCPPTFAPKAVRRVKAMPRQFIAELVYAASRKNASAMTWHAALDIFETRVMREAVYAIMIDGLPPYRAAKMVGMPDNGRSTRVMKANVVAALDAVAQHLEIGGA